MNAGKLSGIGLLIGLFTAVQTLAQQTDTLKTGADSVKSVSKTREEINRDTPPKNAARLALERMPGKAALRSAILPGWGQVYNRKLWWLRVPAIYGGFTGIGLAFEFNNRYYRSFLKEAQFREAFPGQKENPLYERLDNNGVVRVKDQYRRNRDLTILGGAALYALNIIDAYIEAKFKRFDINDDLGLQVKPTLQPPVPAFGATAAPVPGIKLSLSYKTKR